MKVAIDARPLSHDLTGIGRYTLNILRILITKYSTVQWFLLSDRPLKIEFEKHPNLTILTGSCNKKFTSTFFTQYYYPIWCKKLEIDIFWSPRHHLPLALHFNAKIKKIVTIHDIVWKKHPETMSKLGLLLEKLLFSPSLKLSDRILSVSHFTSKELIDNFNVQQDKIKVTSLQSFLAKNTQASIQNDNNKKYILFVGTLEPRKNLLNLLTAFKLLLSNYPTLELIIVGKKGWGEVNLPDVIDTLGISNHIRLTGFVSDSELINLYQNCQLLVMPSLYEGFGLPALEALSLQKKVVVSPLNAIAEIPGDNIYITDTDSDSIVKKMKEALEDTPKYLANVGSDWDIVAKQTYDVLNNEFLKK